MRFSPSFLEDIKARLPVSEVVRRRVKLVKAGREWKGLSPFNSEKTPSFFVNDQKMAWFDFSSGKNGNVFDFVMATEGLSFPETVERLALEAGLPLPVRSEEAERQEQRRAGLHEVLEWGAAFFEAELRGERGAKARVYLDGRGILAKSRTEFRIGYAPADRHALRDALAAKGASVETMCEAGLLIHGEGIPVPYDRFRDRVMFPIADRSGRTIAFGGRALEKDAQAKYLNSPETPIFQKGRVLFNHHRARRAAHEAGRVIAVEGYIDVVAMHSAGFPETVAPLGTALTEDQTDLLWKMAPQPILCFDGDKAGSKAAYRAADLALKMIVPGRSIAFALLPGGLDPDELIKTSGAPAIRELLTRPTPLIDVIWARETENRTLINPDQRAALDNELHVIADTIADRNLRAYYKSEFRHRLREKFSKKSKVDRRGRPRNHESLPPERRAYRMAPVEASSSLSQSATFLGESAAALPAREAQIMKILLAHPGLICEEAEDLSTIELTAKELIPLRDRLIDFGHEQVASAAVLREELESVGLGPIVAKLDRTNIDSSWYLMPDAAAQDAAYLLRQDLALHHRARALHKELLSAEAALATDASEANMARMRDIQEQIGALTGTEAAIEGFGASSGRPCLAL